MTNSISLPELGWRPFFQQQLSLDEFEQARIMRVMAQHRSQLELMTEQGGFYLPVTPSMPAVTVGDWLLVDKQGHFIRLLDRISQFSRKAAGSKIDTQLIAANVDTVFIISSLNHDFNLSRIERYLALTNEAGVEPVIVLTKADCCDNPLPFVRQVQELDPMLLVEAVNCLDRNSVTVLEPWCQTGRTVAFVGSSGAGKSTLINSLQEKQAQTTGDIRHDDSKGRHTTTSRSLHVMTAGGLLLDTPGMRELQLSDCEQGLTATFADIYSLAEQCRFSDCHHQGEPGCAVREAIDSGELNERRLVSYLKLNREQAINGASIAEKRARSRNLGKYYRSVQNESRKRKKG
ncbi:ribosome small subunit-dependent GTPase A [Photobacterium sp.]|uniref:ribosome small subunit-dependent GTPase A n=1 Tax=Photobacterium sp. TaxID=660 RepID=UPI00299E4B1B|nr:ribosome small subunit-dependent GTPase A [Photobacterium sp.]MDX1301808.1 ribosome small subunit-dependent GTPase A [Photobacterium sp.]